METVDHTVTTTEEDFKEIDWAEIAKDMRIMQSDKQKLKNLDKHLKLIKATTGREREVHKAKFQKLLDKYGQQETERQEV